MMHFDMINILGTVLWTDPKYPEKAVGFRLPPEHVERFYNLLEKLRGEQVSCSVDHMLRRLEKQQCEKTKP